MTRRLNHTFKLWKDFSFEAAHQLTKVPTGHQCGNLHGHSYKVRVHCEGMLDERMEWVVDYADIAKAVRPIIEKLDHTLLNHHLDFETTAENLAWWLCETIAPKLPQLSGVEVFETPTTSVLCAWQRNENAELHRPGEAGSVARSGSPAQRESSPPQHEVPQSPAERGIDSTVPTEGGEEKS